MKLNNILNADRVNSLCVEPNAYVMHAKSKDNINSIRPRTQDIEKVIFPEPYGQAGPYYNKHDFVPPTPQEPSQTNKIKTNNNPMFDIKSILPMLMGGKFNDMLKPLMAMLGGGANGGGGLGDMAKIFELFKPKAKTKKEEKKEEDVSSKFDDMIIIED